MNETIQEIETYLGMKIDEMTSLDWTDISANIVLSDDFINAFCDKIDWSAISYAEGLSEKIMDKYQDRVVWDFVGTFEQENKKHNPLL